MMFIEDRRDLQVLGLAVAMTTLAEAINFVVRGKVFFSADNCAAKVVWIAACGSRIDAVIGTAGLLLVEERLKGPPAWLSVALAFAAVIGTCALLCAALASQFNFFGGTEHATLFIFAGVGPAIFGWLLYGWLLFGKEIE